MPVVAQEAEFEMDAEQRAGCRVQPERPELYFCRDMKGYGWCFRKQNFLNVGLGRLDQHRLGEHVSGFVQFLKSSRPATFDIPAGMLGHAYLLYGGSTRKIVDDGLLLMGDAAGLAYEQSGEGIRPAIESGLLAANTISAAQGNYGRQALEPTAFSWIDASETQAKIGLRQSVSICRAAGFQPSAGCCWAPAGLRAES